jgi:hypothetical protein
MRDTDVRLVLDESAIAAYLFGSIGVGETIAEVLDEGRRYGISVAVLAQVVAAADKVGRDLVRLLSGNARCAVLDVLAGDTDRLAEWTRRLGSLGRAASVVAALDRSAGYLLTAEPDRYGELNDTGLIIAV